METIHNKGKIDVAHMVIIIVLCLWGLVILYPFYNSILLSIVPMHEYIRTPFLLYPKTLDLSSYQFVFQWKTILNGGLITLIVTVAGVAYNLLLTVATAYALSKPIPGRKFFNHMIIFTLYFGGGLIPFYLLMIRTLHLQNNILSMILPTGINVTYLLIMRSYFYTIPPEIEESAKIDGANDIQVLCRIVLPLCRPMLATIGLYCAVDRWNEWWYGMLFIQKINLMPMQLFIRNMLRDANVVSNSIPVAANIQVFPQGVQMACIVITTLPIILVYPFLQRYFVKGLVLGGVKG